MTLPVTSAIATGMGKRRARVRKGGRKQVARKGRIA
jgi:hypothetical protein